MLIFIALILFLIILNGKHLTHQLRESRPKTRAVLLCALIIIGTVYWFFIPNVHRIGDEYFLIERAAALHPSITPIVHNSLGENPEDPKDFLVIHLFWILFKFLGVSNIAAIKFNIIIGLISLLLLYILTRELFGEDIHALSCMLIVAASASYMQTITTAYTMPLCILFALLTNWAFFQFMRAGSFSLGLLWMLSLALLPFARIELIVLIPLHLLWLIWSKRTLLNVAHAAYWAKILLVGTIICIFFLKSYVLIATLQMERVTLIGPHHISFTQIKGTFTDFFMPWLMKNMIGWLILPLFLAATMFAIMQAKRRKHKDFFLSIQSMSLAIIYLSMSYFTFWYGALLLVLIAPFITSGICCSYKGRGSSVATIRLAVVFSIFLILLVHSSIVSQKPHLEEAYLLTNTPQAIAPYIEEGCTVIVPYQGPYFHLSQFTIMEFSELNLSHPAQECTYYLEDYNCFIDSPEFGPSVSNECMQIKAQLDLTPILTISNGRSHHNHTLYKVNSKEFFEARRIWV